MGNNNIKNKENTENKEDTFTHNVPKSNKKNRKNKKKKENKEITFTHNVPKSNKKNEKIKKACKKSENINEICDKPTPISENIDECRAIVKQLQLDCDEYNVIGIGCSIQNDNKKIALLQLSSHRGLCALIHLWNLNTIPDELRNFLEDENIVKVCVNEVGDSTFDVAIKLIDYDVQVANILDLRYLAHKCNYQPSKLGGLSEEHLNIKLENYSTYLEHEKWAKSRNHVDIQAINSATKSVQVAIELFKKFENVLMSKESANTPDNSLQTFINEHCKPYLNKVFRNEKINEDVKRMTESEEEKELLRNQKVVIANNYKECQDAVKQLRIHCNEYNVLGFGCKYSSGNRWADLLQLASHCGVCVLVQLSRFDKCPVELQELLEDENILKVGDKVSPNVDRLKDEFGIHVACAMNIQDLAKRCNYPPDDLERLSENHLNISIEALDWRVIRSKWRIMSSREEINYAAKTVHVAIDLYKFFEKKLVAENYSGDRTKFVDEIRGEINKNQEGNNSENNSTEVIPNKLLIPSKSCFKKSNSLSDFPLDENWIRTQPNQEIRVVNDVKECEAVVEQLRIHCNEYNVLGFDCEWIPTGQKKVALLQLATHRGLCALFRLCKLKTIPATLQEILEDDKILKVGVASKNDAEMTFQDYHCKTLGILDLTVLARKCKLRAYGLSRLAKLVLNVSLDYKKRGRGTGQIHTKWEEDTLSEENIKYAAYDAYYAIEIFKKCHEKLMPSNQFDDKTQDVQQFIDEHCKPHIECNKFTIE